MQRYRKPPRVDPTHRSGLRAPLCAVLAFVFVSSALLVPSGSGAAIPAASGESVLHSRIVMSGGPGPLTIDNVTQDPGGASVGGVSNHLFLNVSGGSGSYGVDWSGLPAGCSLVDPTEVACTPTAGGGELAKVSVVVSNASTQVVSGASFWVGSSSENAGSLSVAPTRAGVLTPAFWGTNYNFESGTYANHTIASWLNASPELKNLRLNLLNTLYDTGRVPNWSQVMEFCSAVRCRPELTIGNNLTWTVDQFASALQNASTYLEEYNITPASVVFANEPDLWSAFEGVHITSLPQLAGMYARAVENFTVAKDASPLFRSVPLIGVEMTVEANRFLPFESALLADDGANLSYLDVQAYAAHGANQTLDPQNMLAALWTGTNSLAVGMPGVLQEAATCATCGVHFRMGEGDVGNYAQYAPLKLTYWDIPSNGLGAVSALMRNLTSWSTWDLVTGGSSFIGQQSCEGLLHFAGTCSGWPWNGTTVRPSWFNYVYMYPHLGTGSTYNVSFSADPHVEGMLVRNDSRSARLFVVNANVSEAATFHFGAGFPLNGTARLFEYYPGSGETPLESQLTWDQNSTFTLPAGGELLMAIGPTPATPPPDKPVIQSVGVLGETGLEPSWTNSGNVSNVTVVWGTSVGGNTLSSWQYSAAAGAVTSYIIGRLTPGTRWYIAVMDWNGEVHGPLSATVSQSTAASVPLRTPPPASPGNPAGPAGPVEPAVNPPSLEFLTIGVGLLSAYVGVVSLGIRPRRKSGQSTHA